MAVRAELAEAASLKSKLEESNAIIQGKAAELFRMNKELLENKSIHATLQARLEQALGKAGISEELRAELERYKRQGREYEETIQQVQKDLERASNENKALKNRVASTSLQAQGSGLATRGGEVGFGDLGSVAAGEVDLLRRTVRSLRQQLGEVRAKALNDTLRSTLPPLPPVKNRVYSRGMHTHAENLAADLHSERVSHREQRRKKTLAALSERIAKEMADLRKLRAAPAAVDLSAASTRSGAARLYLTQLSRKRAIERRCQALKADLLAQLGTGQGGKAASVVTDELLRPRTAAAGEGAVLVGRVVVPWQGADISERLVVDRDQLAQLQAIFVGGGR
jgi:hypothetical protein